jgi:hypothetical protein
VRPSSSNTQETQSKCDIAPSRLSGLQVSLKHDPCDRPHRMNRIMGRSLSNIQLSSWFTTLATRLLRRDISSPGYKPDYVTARRFCRNVTSLAPGHAGLSSNEAPKEDGQKVALQRHLTPKQALDSKVEGNGLPAVKPSLQTLLSYLSAICVICYMH